MMHGVGRREELVKAKQLVPIGYFPMVAPDEQWATVTDQAIPNVARILYKRIWTGV